MNSVPRFDGPIYAIAQREAVVTENGKTIVEDFDFLLKMDVIDGQALMLFTGFEHADDFLRGIKNPIYVVASFQGLRHLVTCLDHCLNMGCQQVILNNLPNKPHGYLSTIQNIIEQLKRWMASGSDAAGPSPS